MTPYEDAVALVETTIRSLPAEATLGQRAAAVSELGHPVGFGLQIADRISLAGMAGGAVQNARTPLSVKKDQLVKFVESPARNTIVMDLKVAGESRSVLHFWDRQKERLSVWRVHIDAPTRTTTAPNPPPPNSAARKPSPPAFPPVPLDKASSEVRRTRQAEAACQAVVDDAAATLARIRQEIATDKVRIKEVSAARVERLSEQALAGQPVEVDSSNELLNIETAVEAREAAIPKAEAALAAAQAARETASQAHGRAVLDWVAAEHRSALDALREHLSGALPHLAALVAIDRARGSLLRNGLKGLDARHPGVLGFGNQARTFLRSSPGILKPGDWTDAELDEQADAYRETLQQHLKDTTK